MIKLKDHGVSVACAFRRIEADRVITAARTLGKLNKAAPEEYSGETQIPCHLVKQSGIERPWRIAKERNDADVDFQPPVRKHERLI